MMKSEKEIIEQLLHLDLHQTTPVSIVQANSLVKRFHPSFNPSHYVWIQNILHIHVKKLGLLFGRIYPEGKPIYLVQNDRLCRKVKMESLKNTSSTVDPFCILIPPLLEETSFEGFEELVAHLRAPDGCPWDKEQTHLSLRTHLLEETYETLDALDKGNLDDICEELGDLLLQIVLHAEIGTETGEFRMSDILQGIYRKLFRRHPHVFGKIRISETEEVLRNWERLKESEREKSGGRQRKGILDGVSIGLPALSQAQEYQDRVARVGFDWKDIKPVIAKVNEEMEEVSTAGSDKERAKELGDLLFAVVNLVRWYKVDAESALRNSNRKFANRFRKIELEAKNQHRKLVDMTLEEMDKIWEETKAKEEK